MDRDTRPMLLRTKFTLGVVTITAIVACAITGAIVGALDSNSLAAIALGLSAVGGVTNYIQGRADEKGKS